jgi:hypothetical protein
MARILGRKDHGTEVVDREGRVQGRQGKVSQVTGLMCAWSWQEPRGPLDCLGERELALAEAICVLGSGEAISTGAR